MEYLSETFSQISLEEKRQLTSQYTLFTIGANESVKKLDNRFTVLLNKLRIQKVTKSDQEICETFLNALCRDDWNSNRKILTDRLNPQAPINKISSYSELVTAAIKMEKVDQADCQFSLSGSQANNAETPNQHQSGKRNSHCGRGRNKIKSNSSSNADNSSKQRPYLSAAQRVSLPETGCHHCGELGHRKHNCPKASQPQSAKGKQEYLKWKAQVDILYAQSANNATQQQPPPSPYYYPTQPMGYSYQLPPPTQLATAPASAFAAGSLSSGLAFNPQTGLYHAMNVQTVESPIQPINKPAIPHYSLYPQYFPNPFPQPLLYPPPLPTHAAPVLHAQVKEKEENTEKRVEEKDTVEQVSEANNADLAELCLIDSGCDATHVHQEKFFSETRPSLSNKSVITATGEINKISTEGKIEPANKDLPPLDNASFTPYFKRTLISAGQANKQWKSSIIMDYDSVRMFDRKIGDKDITNRKIGDGKMMGNMYYLPIKVQNSNYSGVTEHDHLPQVDKEHPKSRMDIHPLESIVEEKDPELVELPLRQQTQDLAKRKYQKERRDLMRRERFLLKYWHGRTSHLSGLRRTITLGAVHGLPPSYSVLCDDRRPCWACIQAKQQKVDHPVVQTPTVQEVGELLCLDINFKPIRSIQGNTMTLTLMEYTSRVNFPCHMKNKSEAGANLHHVILYVQKQYSWNVRVIHCDKAPEFIQPGSHMAQVCAALNIRIETSSPHTPEENGVAEAMNKKMTSTAAALMFNGKMPAPFWEYAENLAAILLSYILLPKQTKSGYKMMTGRRPTMSQIRTFGCHAFAFVPKIQRKKYSSKSKIAIYLGPDPMSTGYILWDPNKRKTFDTSSCLFDENNTSIDSLLKLYGDNTRKRPTYTEIEYEDVNMEDFVDMNSNFQAKQHQLPIFKYESRKLNSDADANAPLEQEDIPAPSPPLMLHQNQIPPPPTFNLPTTPLVTATEEPPPFPSPKEKETEDKEQNNIILPINPCRYNRS